MKKISGLLKRMGLIGDLRFLFPMYFMIYMAFSTLGDYFIHGSREYPIITIWQIAGLSLVSAVLHMIQLTKLKTIMRITLHCVLSYMAVAVFSLLCGWGFTETFDIFLQFTGIFILVYAVIFVGFSLHHNNEEEYLNRKLDEYKKSQQ